MRTAIVVGNPKPGSRTLDAARMVASRIDPAEPLVVDVVEHESGLFGWGSDEVRQLIEQVRQCDLLIVGSPTYKASFTGLVKMFLDLFPNDGLRGVVGVPLMLGAAPGHALASEVHLKPVLVELGAVCPSKALYLLDSTYADGVTIDTWCETARPLLLAAIS